MSNQLKNINLVSLEKNDNLISMDKYQNNNPKFNSRIDNNFNRDSTNFNANLISKNNIFPNDLINTKNEDELNFSNTEDNQKFIHNADILFNKEDDLDEKENHDINSYKDNSSIVSNLNINNIREQDANKSNMSSTENKRIQFANNLFDNSIRSSILSNNNESSLNQSLVSENRKEAAEELFHSSSEAEESIKQKKSLNFSVKSKKSNKTNMSNVINNLTGSNIGLTINQLANKYAENDKIINESMSIKDYISENENENDSNNVQKKVTNRTKSIEYDKDIDEEIEDDVEFKKNLEIFQNNMGNEKNKSNNLKDIYISSSKKDNEQSEEKKIFKKSKNLEKSKIYLNKSKDEDKLSNNKNNSIINDKKSKNGLNISSSEIDINNNIFDNLPKIKQEDNKKEEEKKDNEEKNNVLNESDENENKGQKKTTLGINFIKLFKIKNQKKQKNNDNRKVMVDSDEETSNDLLNNKIKRERSKINNESNLINHSKSHSKIIEEDIINISKINKKKEKKSKINSSKIEDESKIEKSNDNINNNIIEKDNNLIHVIKNSLRNEKDFITFLKNKNISYIGNLYNKEDNKTQLNHIKDNSYFENYIIKQETIYDYIIKKKIKIPFYPDDMKKTYERNKDNFNLLFQFVSSNNKDKLFKLYKAHTNYNISNYLISPYLYSLDNILKNIKNVVIIKKDLDIEYIRYIVDENEGDTFYRCFIFSLFEKYILEKRKDNIFSLIFDIYKLYDISPTIFDDNESYNISNTLTFFAILTDYIQLNIWDKVYDIFITLYSQIDKILITYVKYNIFLYLSKIYSENNLEDNKGFINQYKKILVGYNEPSNIIFQLIPFIFGVNLNIDYYINTSKDKLSSGTLSYTSPKIIGKNEIIRILYFNNCYHIGYSKDSFNKYKILSENLTKSEISKFSLINSKIFCEKCNKNVKYIELVNDENKNKICLECVNNLIDEHLTSRINFIKDDYKKNFINYSYYLRPIELYLEEPLLSKDNIENNSITIKNIDYFILFQITFEQRISELFSQQNELESISTSTIKNGSKNETKINHKDEFNPSNDICSFCQKLSDILVLECGCKFCQECLNGLFSTITNDNFILNGYEKMKLVDEDKAKCPICEQKINLQYLILLFEQRGRDFEVEYIAAKERMKKYCQTLCFLCLKEFSNENSLEVPNNIKKKLFQIKVMINKYSLKVIKNNKNKNDQEEGIDYSNTTHVVCFDCHKKNKNVEVSNIDNKRYKIFICNICGNRHLVYEKDWDKWYKSDICCKCNIY